MSGVDALRTELTRVARTLGAPEGLEPQVERPRDPALGDWATHHALMLAHPEAIDDFTLALQQHNVERDRMKRRRLSRTDVLLQTLPAVRAPVAGIWGALDALYVGQIERVAPALRAAPAFAPRMS